jgi:putative ABC transport system ATP-binding protein
MSLIHVEDLKKIYSLGDTEVRALDGVTFDIETKEFIAVMGSSGSGKSTLMNILGCLDRPTSGKYFLNDREVSQLGRGDLAEVRNQTIGFVFQNFNLLSRTSAIENVELPLVYAGVGSSARHDKAKAALERVGLGSRIDHRPSQLSGGQQQRVAIARAIVNSPKLILADEPTGNLDSKTSIEVMALFQELWERESLTIMLVTHEPDIAEYASRVIALRDGRIVDDRPIARRKNAASDLKNFVPPEEMPLPELEG